MFFTKKEKVTKNQIELPQIQQLKVKLGTPLWMMTDTVTKNQIEDSFEWYHFAYEWLTWSYIIMLYPFQARYVL